MRLVEVREESAFEGMRSEWNQLLRASASDSIFLTWEWLGTWWRSYGRDGELRLLAAYDEASGALQGIAPLRSQKLTRYGQTAPSLAFVGDGSNDSDYLDFIAAPGREEAVMQAFAAWLAEKVDRGTVLELNEVPETSPNAAGVRQLLGGQGRLMREASVDCGTVLLPESWEGYLGILRPRFRTKVRSVLRNLESRTEVRFGFCENAEQIQHMLPILYDLHTRRWVEDGKPGVFGGERKRAFYDAMSLSLLERDWLRFSWLEWNGRILACQYGFVYGSTYSQLQEGYEPACEHWNVGVGLRAWSIRELLKQGIRQYDFLGGVGRHKTDWGAQVKQSFRFRIAADNWKNRLLCHGPEWESRARETVKKIVPEKFIAWRSRRIEQRSLARLRKVTTDTPEGPGKEWVRQVAARCYYHLHLPALTRGLRERYQLAPRSAGRAPIMWERRKVPTVRVMYYHRVNDDRDPFFDALPTHRFEYEMRYLARHHRVVSLREAMERLDAGVADPVVAITFDDGYQDNYQNAFPILQRLKLPATIFLTTGSIDSREPLWFEQLAQTLKCTTREHVDLAIDLPRRFWLRTQVERLEASRQIFHLLRQRDDSERQRWLAEILRALGPVDQSERMHKLLTWDQIRLMKASGVDFGGHSVTHPFLSRLKRDRAVWEVTECKKRIEEELQAPADYFAYPSGREGDFGIWNKELIRAAGYRAAFTTIWGANYKSTDLMELRRGGPWEDAPALFAFKLDWYQLVNE